ncbi:MAG: hypothetical protein HOV81_11895 [Kofleriaceae bacterium]|nr:hypothetical protein [Kofleriaceae bacterium]
MIPRIAIFLTALAQMASGDVLYGVFCLFALAITLIPAIATGRLDAGIPLVLELGLLCLMITDMTLGNLWGFYRLPWYDKAIHLGSSLLVGMIGLLAIYVLDQTGRVRFHPWLAGLAILLVTLGVGALWEIAEYIIDQLFDRAAQTSPGMSEIDDTMIDLILDGVGGLAAALVGPYFIRHSHRTQVELRELADLLPA